MEKIEVSVIIVSYNTKNVLVNCLDSILNNSNGVFYEIIVVDNNSSDGTVDLIKRDFGQIKLVENCENWGFGRACNLGVSHAKGEFLLFLNSDTKLVNNALDYFQQFMRLHNNNKDIGAIGSILLNDELLPLHSYGYFPQIIGYFTRLCTKHKIKKNFLTQTFEYFEVDYITGANLFMRRDVFERLGQFRPDYFMYYEETDLQKRMSKNNLRRIIIRGPRIVHLQGQSFQGQMLYEKKVVKYKSMFTYYRLNHTILENIIIRFYYGLFFFPLVILRRPYSRFSYILYKSLFS